MERIGNEPARDNQIEEPELAAALAATPEPVPAPIDAPNAKSRLRRPLILAGIVALVIGGIFFYLSGGRYEATDDAALQAGQVAIAANVSGPVISVDVHENQSVKTGQVLLRLDPAPFQAAVDEAEAKLADARAQVHALRANVRQGEAQVGAAQAQLTYATAEAARQKALLAEGISSRNQYDQAALAVATARQQIQTTSEQTQSVRASLAGGVQVPEGDQPAVKAALAVLNRARLNLGYTIVRAPQDGVVTRVNQLQTGNYVTAARPVFSLVGARIWVEANFKESQLRYMRLGQHATVTVDAYSDRPLKAHLASFSPGTGNSFSLLPAENATGNWVKVVQRLPVQFELDERPGDLPLHAGLSANVETDTGHVRHLFGGSDRP